MARHMVWKDHGTIERYRQGGCDDLTGGKPGAGDRCSKCRAAMSSFNRDRNSRGPARNGSKIASVTSIDGRKGSKTAAAQSKKPDREIGFNEAAVIKATEQYRESSPAYVALAISAARDLDDPELVGSRPTMMRNLTQILDKLEASKKKKSRGRLAAVQSMTNSHQAVN